jgi:hexulose-6-phosphate isomerase
MPTDPSLVSRRTALQSALAAGGMAALVGGAAGAEPKPDDRRAAPKRYDMKKSINLWAFPYPQRMTLKECLRLARDAGFDGIELNYDLDNDLSPKAGAKELRAIRKTAEEIGIAISGLCSFLYWPYSLTSNNAAQRARGLELANLMLTAAHELGTENLLVVPGAVCIPWIKDHDPVAADVCDRRARAAVGKLVPRAEKLGVYLNIENIFFSGYLLSPADLIAFVDGFKSEHVRVHFDTGNIMLFQLPFPVSYATMRVSPLTPKEYRTWARRKSRRPATATRGSAPRSKRRATANGGRAPGRRGGAGGTTSAWTRRSPCTTGGCRPSGASTAQTPTTWGSFWTK